MRRLLMAAFAILLITACDRDEGRQDAAANVEMWRDAMPIHDPWLRDHLPDDTLAYMRIPNLFGLTAMPKGNVLDPALRSRANVESVQKILDGVNTNILPLLAPDMNSQVLLLARHLRSPVEVATRFIPAPGAIIGAHLDIDSAEALELTLVEAGLPLSGGLDAQGIGELVGAPMPVFLQFDAANGRVLAAVGPGVNRESFADMVDNLDRNSSHPMRDLESRVDSSGQGFFAWIDAEQAQQPMQMFVPLQVMQTLNELGMEQLASVGFGLGVANGKGRMALVANLHPDTERGLIPQVSNALTARSVGDPDGLFLLSIPTAEEFARLEAATLALVGLEDADDWQALKAEMAELTGVTPEEIFAAVGPEILFIFDGAGDYLAVRLRDAALWDSILERLGAKTAAPPERRELNGRTYFHWGLPNEFAMAGDELIADMGWLGEIGARQQDHVYWTIEDDFMYMASVPQPLIDRHRLGPDTRIEDWLEARQRVEGDHAIFLASGVTHKLPRRLYTFYIEMLHVLSDLAQADIDVWSMPTPHDLGLPDEGSIGLTISLGDPTLVAELTFENNPLEIFGGLGGVAAAGILAAIAIPAYQDYTVRAQVSTGLALAGPVKAAVTAYHEEYGQLPDAAAALEMSVLQDAGEYVWSITVEPEVGQIVIQYVDDVAGGGRIVLEPFEESVGVLTWSCYGTFEDKLLPASCRY